LREVFKRATVAAVCSWIRWAKGRPAEASGANAPRRAKLG
jgi:hypothetical protein